MIRSAILTCSVLLAGSSLAPPARSAATETNDDVPFETLGIVADSTGINLYPPASIRVRSIDDIEATRALLATGFDRSFADRVIDVIGEIPAGRVVLVGVVEVSCTRASVATLERTKDGQLVMSAPAHVDETITCYVPMVSVAVLSVDADDAPPGSTDAAELVAFQALGDERRGPPSGVELTTDANALRGLLGDGTEQPDLPERAAGDRRFAFVRSGCQNTTAELIVTPRVIDARVDDDNPEMWLACEQAEYFLAVFDIAAENVRQQVELVGS